MSKEQIRIWLDDYISRGWLVRKIIDGKVMICRGPHFSQMEKSEESV